MLVISKEALLASKEPTFSGILIVVDVDSDVFVAPVDRRSIDNIGRFVYMPSLHQSFHKIIGFTRSTNAPEMHDMLKLLYPNLLIVSVPAPEDL